MSTRKVVSASVPATPPPATARRRFNYPRAGKGPVHRWIPSWKFVLLSFTTLFVFGAAILVTAYITTEIPEPDDFAQAQNTTIYYSDGETVMGTFAQQNREIIDYDTLPAHVGQAVVASEDRTFWDNQGINPKGMVRAFLNNVRGGSQQGGSTITQQYAERYYLGTTKDYVGKFKEAILAVKLSQAQDKDEILGNYLNTIYYGRGAYGIQTAAQAFFGVDAAQLDVSQAAMIAGIIPAPSAWDPAKNPERAEQRWNRVLDFMVEDGYISATERAGLTFPEVVPVSQGDTYAGPQGYLLQMAREEILTATAMTEDELDTRGLRIVTTIDVALQKQIEEAATYLPDDAPEGLHLAMVTIDPKTGEIKALYGGADYLKRQRNAVTQDRAQAGSTFKPFTLVAGLESGVSLDRVFNGNSNREFPGFDRPVRNYGGTNYGQVTLTKATANSVNTAYVELNSEVGPEKTREVAIRAGLPEDTTGLEAFVSNVLGPASPHPLDMAAAYATFANEGMRTTPHIVQSAHDLGGGLIYSGPDLPTRAFDESVMADTTYALQQVVTSGSGSRARLNNQPVAGKTGTSSDAKSAWFVGYTPYYSTAVAIYQTAPDGSEMPIDPFGGHSSVTGGRIPAELWGTYMAMAHEGLPRLDFPPRASTPATATPTEEPTVEPTDEPTLEPTDDPSETPDPGVTFVDVPGQLAGLDQAAAAARLEEAGLVAVFRTEESDQPPGVVLRSEPGAGTSVPEGSRITLVVSGGPGTGPSEPAG